ncbi:MAG: hypothetical protein ACPG31_01815 [Planctomycetota bacterium]
MRLLPTLAVSLLVLGQAQGQDQNYGIAVSKTGEEASEAFHAWIGSRDMKPQYPAQIHITFDMEMDMGMSGEDPFMDMDFEMDTRLLIESPEAMRSWGQIDLAVKADANNEFDGEFDFQFASDDTGMRFLLDDHGAIQEKLGMDIPKAYSLSADRGKIFMDAYAKSVVEMINVVTPEGHEPIAALENGVIGLFHPISMTYMMANYPGLKIVGWGVKDGKVLLQTQADFEMLEEIMPQEMIPFDMNEFRDIVYTMVMDHESGALLEYSIDLEIPMDSSMMDEDLGFSGNIGFKMSMRAEPASASAPSVSLPDASLVMDLDGPFDMYWPMVQTMLEMQASQFESMKGEQDSNDDFDF